MNVLIVGSGMYVTGRGGTGMGTILTAVVQVLGKGKIHKIKVCAINPSNYQVVAETTQRIEMALGFKTNVEYQAYDGTIEELSKLALEGEIDVAIVATPDSLHFNQIRSLINLGIHCLCVKPLVPTVAEHQELIELARGKDIHTAIEFHKRWDESNLHVRKTIQEGRLGKLHNISVDYSQRIMIPTEVFSGWADQTNIFQYLGIHYVDLVQWLTDAIPVRLCCHATTGVLLKLGLNTWDSVHVWLIWRRRNGEEFLSQFNLSWVDSNQSPALSDQRFSVLGSHGRYDVDQRNRGIAATIHGQGVQYINPWFSELLPSLDGYYEMQGYGLKSIERFLKDCHLIMCGEISPRSLVGRRPTFEDCLDSTRVIECVNCCLENEKKEFVDVSL